MVRATFCYYVLLEDIEELNNGMIEVVDIYRFAILLLALKYPSPSLPVPRQSRS